MKDGLALTDPSIGDHQTTEATYLIMDNDGPFAFAGVFPTNYVYNVKFGDGIDWTHLLVKPSSNYDPTDKTIVFQFNYVETRELYEIKKFSAGKATTDYPALTALASFYD